MGTKRISLQKLFKKAGLLVHGPDKEYLSMGAYLWIGDVLGDGLDLELEELEDALVGLEHDFAVTMQRLYEALEKIFEEMQNE